MFLAVSVVPVNKIISPKIRTVVLCTRTNRDISWNVGESTPVLFHLHLPKTVPTLIQYRAPFRMKTALKESVYKGVYKGVCFAAVGTLRNMWIGAQKHDSYMNASKASRKSDKRTSRYESRARTSGSLSPSKWKGLILTSCDWRFLFFARRPLVAKFWHILVDSHLQKRLIWMDFQIRPLPWPGPVEVGLRVHATKKFDRRLH